ncbi:MAG: NPCBM/NEW2 domain-containing protein [Pirellulales bacterium]
MLWLLAIAAISLPSYEVSVRTVNGDTVEGSVAAWDQSGIELTTGSGSVRHIPRGELAELTFPASESVAAVPPVLEVLLVDGSVIPAAGCAVQSQEIRVIGPIGAVQGQPEWKLPADAVNAVRFDLSDSSQDEAWQQLTQRERTSDLLVVQKKNRGTLDFVEGVIKQVTAEMVTIEMDQEPVEVPRGKAFGIVFYRRGSEQAPKTLLTLRGPHRMVLVARDVRLGADRIGVDLSGGDTVEVNPSSLTKLEFTSDTFVPLTGLEPADGSTRWQPFFGLPDEPNQLAEWGMPRIDTSFHGGQLRLMLQDESMQPSIREFDRGLAIRSRSEASYQLPAGYRSLKAIVGIDPAAHADAEALLLIEADGQIVDEWQLARSEPAKSIDVDISGKRKLRLLVDYGSGTDAGDVVHICDPRLIK